MRDGDPRAWKTTDDLVATPEEIFSYATIRRLLDDEANDPECTQLVKITYRDYVREGGTSKPIQEWTLP